METTSVFVVTAKIISSSDKEIRTVFPVAKIRKKAAQENKPAPKKDYGTIRVSSKNVFTFSFTGKSFA